MLNERFIRRLKHGKKYSLHTLIAYESDLNAFGTYILQTKSLNIFDESYVDKIGHKDLRKWMSELVDQGIQNRSIARKLATIKSYFSFLVKEGILSQSPAAKISAPRFEKKLPVFVKEKEMGALLDPAGFPDSFEGVRNRCILEILYGCGLRRSELIGLTHQAVDVHKQTLKVLGKGNKERLVPFGKNVLEALLAYRSEKIKLGLTLEGVFFCRENGAALYPNLVLRLAKEHLLRYGNVSRNSPHILRHTYATHLLDNGADLNAIKELLGHSGLAATQVYTHNSISKLAAVYRQAHPRAEAQ